MVDPAGVKPLCTFDHEGRQLPLYAWESEPGPAAGAGAERPAPRPSASGRPPARPSGSGRPPARPSGPGRPPLSPGAGHITISGLALRGDAPGNSLTLTATVTGSNIAHVFTEFLLKDPGAQRYYGPLGRVHVRATQEREVGGLTHPVWEAPIDLAVPMPKRLLLLTDGAAWALCAPLPEGYGSSQRRVAGLYTPAGADEGFAATLTFAPDGGLSGASAGGAAGGRPGARGLIPGTGDRFSPLVDILEPAAGEGSFTVTGKARATTLTFGDRRLWLSEQDLLPAEMLVGLVVQDFDGTTARYYTRYGFEPTIVG